MTMLSSTEIIALVKLRKEIRKNTSTQSQGLEPRLVLHRANWATLILRMHTIEFVDMFT